jgi:hypothetical protein
MYQRYYKQRKFGRVFSVFLIIGSGLSHYIKEGKEFIKGVFSMNTLNKYEEYLPNITKEFIQEFKENDLKSISDNYLKTPGTEEKIKFWNDCYNYNKNLDLFKKEYNTNYLFSVFEEKKKESFENENKNENKNKRINETKNYDHLLNENSENKNMNKNALINFTEEDSVNIYLYDKFRIYEKKFLSNKI